MQKFKANRKAGQAIRFVSSVPAWPSRNAPFCFANAEVMLARIRSDGLYGRSTTPPRICRTSPKNAVTRMRVGAERRASHSLFRSVWMLTDGLPQRSRIKTNKVPFRDWASEGMRLPIEKPASIGKTRPWSEAYATSWSPSFVSSVTPSSANRSRHAKSDSGLGTQMPRYRYRRHVQFELPQRNQIRRACKLSRIRRLCFRVNQVRPRKNYSASLRLEWFLPGKSCISCQANGDSCRTPH